VILLRSSYQKIWPKNSRVSSRVTSGVAERRRDLLRNREISRDDLGESFIDSLSRPSSFSPFLPCSPHPPLPSLAPHRDASALLARTLQLDAVLHRAAHTSVARSTRRSSPLLSSSLLSSPLLSSCHPVLPRLTSCCCRALTRSLARPFASPGGSGTLLRLPHARNRKGETAAMCASARVERKKIGRADDGGWSSYRSR